MLGVLTLISLVLGAVYVLVLAVTLILTAYHLRRAATFAEQLAGGLEAVRGHTAPLPEHLTTINGALVQLKGGLLSVDGHYATLARAVGLE